MIVVATAKTRKGKVNEIDSNSPEMGTPTKEANPQLNSVPAAAAGIFSMDKNNKYRKI